MGVNPVRSVKMVSRRKILSRSRDDLNLDDDAAQDLLNGLNDLFGGFPDLLGGQ